MHSPSSSHPAMILPEEEPALSLPPSVFSITKDDHNGQQPATEALSRSSSVPLREKKRARGARGHRYSTTKRDATEKHGSFDFTNLLEASKPVEYSLAFPLIEWSVDDDQETFPCEKARAWLNMPEEREERTSLGKRSRSFPCRSHNGLVRSIALNSDLPSLLEPRCYARRDVSLSPTHTTSSPRSNEDGNASISKCTDQTTAPDFQLPKFASSVPQKTGMPLVEPLYA